MAKSARFPGRLSNSTQPSNGLGGSQPLQSSHLFPHHQPRDPIFTSQGPSLGCIPSASTYNQSFDTLATHDSHLWAGPHLSFANSDWNFPSINPQTQYLSGYNGVHVALHDVDHGVPSTFDLLSDSGSNVPRPFPSLILSPSNSHGKLRFWIYTIPLSNEPFVSKTSYQMDSRILPQSPRFPAIFRRLCLALTLHRVMTF